MPAVQYLLESVSGRAIRAQVAEPEGFGMKKSKGKATDRKRAASADPSNSIKNFFKKERPTDLPSTSAAANARAASPPAHGSASAPVSAAASPDRDSMRRLLADAAMRRLAQVVDAAQSASQVRVEPTVHAPAQPRANDREVVVISDSD